MGLGMAFVDALYVSAAMAFSSTIIIVKLLSDKREIDSLHGRIAIGFLIVQDILVILTMIMLSALGGSGDEQSFSLGMQIFQVIGKGTLFLAGLGILMRYVLPGLLKQIARYPELLILFSVTWAVFLAVLGDTLGFSKEVGAFLAGVSIASTPYRESIGSKLVSLRDFLLLFFFIDLGARLDLSLLGTQMGKATIFSLFVLIGNPLIVVTIMGVMGYRKRTGFLAGLAVAQISEFSLILGALGMSLGHIQRDVLGLITLIVLLTIGLSTYMILYSSFLYDRLASVLTLFERKVPFREATSDAAAEDVSKVNVILFGLGSYGSNITRYLLRRNKKVMGVDFDPQVLEEWREQGLPVLYGDVEDPEMYEHLPLQSADWVISATPVRDTNLALLKALREHGYSGKVALTAHNQEDADLYAQAGADVLLRPFVDAAEQAADSLTAATKPLQDNMLWPVTLGEIRLRPGSVFSGVRIGKIPLRAETGVTILAISRAGRSFFDLGPDFRLYPGDRLILLGEPENLNRAMEYLDRQEAGEATADEPVFTVVPLDIPDDSPWVGKTLTELNFRKDYGVTVIGIQRGERQITAPAAQETLLAGDCLMIAGSQEAVENLNRSV